MDGVDERSRGKEEQCTYTIQESQQESTEVNESQRKSKNASGNSQSLDLSSEVRERSWDIGGYESAANITCQSLLNHICMLGNIVRIL